MTLFQLQPGWLSPDREQHVDGNLRLRLAGRGPGGRAFIAIIRIG